MALTEIKKAPKEHINKHILKIQEKYYNDIINGKKTFEIRKNDRNFHVGDHIQFIVIPKDESKDWFISNESYIITYILDDFPIAFQPDYIAFSIAKLLELNRK